MGDTCKKIAGAQPAGFSEFGGGAFAVTFEGVGGSEWARIFGCAGL